MSSRPELSTTISSSDFQNYYWLKSELMSFCRIEKIPCSGSKFELEQRIIYYLETGKVLISKKLPKLKSKFDWNTEPLNLKTVITDNYKNSENVRSFFVEQIGKEFKFNIKFMKWMKQNTGLTLHDAIAAWKNIKAKKTLIRTEDISPQFEYNRYLKDFLRNNPDKSRNIGIRLWHIKKSLRGSNAYDNKDLDLINN